MPSFSTGTVTALLAQRKGLQRVEVDGHPAYVLTEVIGPVAVGDRVVINTTAVDLGLGSGGSHLVHWNLASESWQQPGPGHILKLRYTSLQTDTGAAEELGPFCPASNLGDMPVVACDLHSQVACVALAFHQRAPRRRLVYVMTDSAALPMALSDTVAELRAAGVLVATISAGQAFGGDFEAVNLYSALEVAEVMAGADAVVVGPGPGVVGTGTQHGFSGMEVVTVLNAAARLGGRPIVAVRYSDGDSRARHRGVSHHTATCLQLVAYPVQVAVPRGAHWEPLVPVDLMADEAPPLVEAVEVEVAHIDFGSITTMGRGVDQEPGFFSWSAAAGVLAAQLLDLERADL